MAQMHSAQQAAAPEQGNKIAKLTNLAGAAISLALVVGVGVWGYKLLVRDVSGVPVVRAAEGPMRVQPDDPGGRQALHQGLAVNAVAAEGTAEKPADRLILAPKPLELTLDDVPAAELAVARAPDDAPTETPGQPAERAEAPAELSDIDRAVQLAAAQVPQAASGATPGTTTAESTDAAAGDERETVEGGLGTSLRPQLRPASLGQVREVSAPARTGPQEVDPADIPAGTRLAQLGAFESAEIARQEWTRLSGRFAEYLEGKDRVIEKAQSGGRTFYRLRAMGFADVSDARRFCSALTAENADCIPVVTR